MIDLVFWFGLVFAPYTGYANAGVEIPMFDGVSFLNADITLGDVSWSIIEQELFTYWYFGLKVTLFKKKGVYMPHYTLKTTLLDCKVALATRTYTHPIFNSVHGIGEGLELC